MYELYTLHAHEIFWLYSFLPPTRAWCLTDNLWQRHLSDMFLSRNSGGRLLRSDKLLALHGFATETCWVGVTLLCFPERPCPACFGRCTAPSSDDEDSRSDFFFDRAQLSERTCRSRLARSVWSRKRKVKFRNLFWVFWKKKINWH